MRASLMAVGVAAALLVSAVPVLAAEGKDDNGSRGRGQGPSKPTPVAIGEFEVDRAQGRAVGEYVSFSYNASGIQDFAAGGVGLFDLAVEGGLGHLDQVRADKSKLVLRADGYSRRVHDLPGATTLLSSEQPVVFTFVEDASVSVHLPGEGATVVVGDLSGKVLGENVSVSGRSVRAEGDVKFYLDSVQLDRFGESRQHITRAIERRHVGVEASFNRLDGDGIEQDVVSYGNVTMTTLRAAPGNLTVLVEGHGFEGRVLVLNVDGRVVGAARSEHLHVLFDNETIHMAEGGLADALDPDDDGLRAEYYVVFDPLGEAFQLVVSVPHYSVHTLSVTTIFPHLKPSVVVGIVAGVALLVPSAMVLFRRRAD